MAELQEAERPSTSDTAVDARAAGLNSTRPKPGMLKRLAGLAVVALVLVLLGINLAKSWTTLTAYRWQVSLPLLVLAFLGFVAQTLTYPLIWRLILRRLGHSLPLGKSARIYLAAEFVRYIPGNVWHVLTRILWAEREGVPKAIGFVSMTVELVTKLASGALIFAATLVFWPRVEVLDQALGGQTLLLVGLAALPLMLVLLQPRLLGWCLNRLLSALRKPPISLPLRYQDVLLIVVCWCGSWVIGGSALYLLVVGILGAGNATTPASATGGASPAAVTQPAVIVLALCIGIYALGWDIGFLSFITPSGLGFQEAAIILLLGLALVTPGVALATVIAFLARVLRTLGELLCVGGAHLIVTRLERARQVSGRAEPAESLPLTLD